MDLPTSELGIVHPLSSNWLSPLHMVESGSAVQDEMTVEGDQHNELPQLVLGCRKQKVSDHLDLFFQGTYSCSVDVVAEEINNSGTPKRLFGTLMRMPCSSSHSNTNLRCWRCSSGETLAIKRSSMYERVAEMKTSKYLVDEPLKRLGRIPGQLWWSWGYPLVLLGFDGMPGQGQCA